MVLSSSATSSALKQHIYEGFIVRSYYKAFLLSCAVKNPQNLRKHLQTQQQETLNSLLDLGILVPQEGKHRNVPYSIVISKDIILTPCPEDEEE